MTKESLIRAVISATFVIALLLAVKVEAQATIRRVPADYPTIQQAINASVNGDTVLVAPGIYVENINFIGKAISVASELGAQVTIIDGNQNAPVVTFVSGEGRSSGLTGFTLRNGRAPAFIIEGGGGIRIENSSPTIRDNLVTQNRACGGAGILISGGAPLIQANTITQNAQQGCTGGDGGGGVLVNGLSTAEIIGNTISFNSISASGGGIAVLEASPLILMNIVSDNGAIVGSGISISGFPTSAIVQRNTIANNFKCCGSGGPGGGGILASGSATVQILENVISNNNAGNEFGGGISISGAIRATVQGNSISNNMAGSGGGIYTDNSGPRLILQNRIFKNRAVAGGGVTGTQTFVLLNNTIVDNDAAGSSGVLANFSPETQALNNIIVAKSGQAAFSCDGFVPESALKNNNVFSPVGIAYGDGCPDLTGINGNISADPLFVNPSAGDYRLRPGSPSIDAGDNTAPNLPATDLDGNPRIQDGNGDGIAVVDMGAYESLPPAPPFDICIQDDSTRSIFKFNSSTGDYQFTSCSGLTLNGTGSLIQRGSTITLQHYSSDRRILARIDTSVNKATASIQLFSPSTTFTITDRNTSNNSCACAPQ